MEKVKNMNNGKVTFKESKSYPCKLVVFSDYDCILESGYKLRDFHIAYQTYGQLNGSVFYATDQTKLYRNIGIGIKIFGLLVTFYLIAPSSYGGLALGASGIALSMIIVQFIGVNVQLLFNTKYLNISCMKFLFHQGVVIGAFSLMAYISNSVLEQLVQNEIIFLIGNATLYFILTFILIFLFPMMISMTRSEIVNQLKFILQGKNSK